MSRNGVVMGALVGVVLGMVGVSFAAVPLYSIFCKATGFGGTTQFIRAFRTRFGVAPRQYLALVRKQDLDWHETRLVADGFDQNAFLWRQRGLNGPEPSSAPD